MAATARGFCQTHYVRWKKHGDPMAGAQRPPGLCAVEGCGRKRRTREWCDKHYRRWLAYGDPLSLARVPGQTCSVEGCAQDALARGMCGMHWKRWRKHGDPTIVVSNWKGGVEAYGYTHVKIRRLKGSASEHICIECGAPAEHWAYDHTDPDEQTCPKGRVYSTDPSHYQPMCRPCHATMDAGHRNLRLTSPPIWPNGADLDAG